MLFDKFNFSTGTHDSIFIIVMAKIMATGDISSWWVGSPRGFGIFIPTVSFCRQFLGFGLSPFAPAKLSPSYFLLTFFYFCHRLTKEYITSLSIRVWLVILTTLTLFSTPIVFYNIFYIHTNFVASAFFFTAVCSFWLGIREDSNPLLFLGLISLLGFSLCRPEAPLFALIVLAILFSQTQISYRKRIYLGIPYAISMIVWHWLIGRMETNAQTDVMTAQTIYQFITIFIVFSGSVIISKVRWIEKYIYLTFIIGW